MHLPSLEPQYGLVEHSPSELQAKVGVAPFGCFSAGLNPCTATVGVVYVFVQPTSTSCEVHSSALITSNLRILINSSFRVSEVRSLYKRSHQRSRAHRKPCQVRVSLARTLFRPQLVIEYSSEINDPPLDTRSVLVQLRLAQSTHGSVETYWSS